MTPFKKYLLITLVLALLNAVLILAFFFPRYDHTDTSQYISTIENISGDKSAEIFPFRILKPLPILIGALLTNFTAAENTLIIQNVFFYFFFVILIYLLVYRIYRREKQAFYGAVLAMTAYPMLAYGLASLTDLPGWFFFLLSALLILDFLKNPNFKTAGLIGLVAGFGMLFKENVAAAPIFFVSFLFLAIKLPLREKLKYILTYGVAFLFPVLINSVIIYKLYSYSYFHWFFNVWHHEESTFYAYSFLRILIETGRVFSIGWLFVFFGAFKEFIAKNIERTKILLALLPPSLSFFLWAYPHNRMIFIAFPLLILLGSFGLLRNWKNQRLNIVLELGILALYILVNYSILEFLLRYGPIFQ